MSTAPDIDPLNSRELEVKAAELEARQLEADKALAAARSPWWRREPLVLAILAAAATLLGNIVAERLKALGELDLQKTKARYDLILDAMKTQDIAAANRNINFFIDSGLLEDSDCRIREAIERYQPVLPSLSGTAPPTPAGMHSVPEIMTLYDFPPGFDGRGQTIGILEFGGHVISKDLTEYFKSISLPAPEVTTILIDKANEKSDEYDAQVMLDLEMVGSIAPRAHIRVYFATFNAVGVVEALKRAEADHVSVVETSWGQPETDWKDQEIKAIDAALEGTAKQRITVIAAAGNQGRHVSFPGSSPWVLSVGGTSLKSKAGSIISEVVWKDPSGSFATGGGVSEKFDRPDWQSGVSVPTRDDGKSGRGIPDVVASADPQLGVPIIIRGQKTLFGGTAASVPLWAGLIAQINQAVGYNVGYLNPRLYREMGSAGLFNTITSGDNSVSGVKGYTAGPGWTPVAGWGSPNGAKLLSWLRAHPDPSLSSTAKRTACIAEAN